MIRFSCEKCLAMICAPAGTSGQFASCPRCHLAVTIPDPPAAGANGPPPSAEEITYPSYEVVEDIRTAAQDDGDDWIDRRRRKRERERAARRRLLVRVSTALAAAVLAVVTLTLACGKLRRVRDQQDGLAQRPVGDRSDPELPPRPAPTDDLTHRELAERIAGRGVKVRMIASGRSGAAYLVDPTFDRAEDWGNATAADESGPFPGMVRFSRLKDAETARRAVGELPPDSATFAWGPWVFSGDRALLGQIRGALR